MCHCKKERTEDQSWLWSGGGGRIKEGGKERRGKEGGREGGNVEDRRDRRWVNGERMDKWEDGSINV